MPRSSLFFSLRAGEDICFVAEKKLKKKIDFAGVLPFLYFWMCGVYFFPGASSTSCSTGWASGPSCRGIFPLRWTSAYSSSRFKPTTLHPVLRVGSRPAGLRLRAANQELFERISEQFTAIFNLNLCVKLSSATLQFFVFALRPEEDGSQG